MQDKMERLIRVIYRKYKSGSPPKTQEHPDEETMVCFMEGRLSEKEAGLIKQHLISCQNCAEVFITQLKLEVTDELKVPEELIAQVKNLLSQKDPSPVLEIFLKLKENLLELLSTTGDILVGQELVPAPVLRSRKIKDFKDEVTILKDFNNIRIELKIETKGASIFSLIVLVKEKQTLRVIKDLRVTLLKDGLELESYLTDLGKVTFEHILLGKYTVEISNIENKLASILLDVKT